MRLPSWVSDLGRELGLGLLHLVFPGLCHLCGSALEPGSGAFCPRCRDGLRHDPHPACPHCGATVGPFVNLDGGCVLCRDVSFAFDAVIRFGPYEDPWRSAVLRLKHHSGEGLAELLGELWGDHCRARFEAVKADVVVPVPLHWRRRWNRGYNQSAALALGLASVLRLPMQRSWLRRIKNTPSQYPLAATARRENIRKAFAVTGRARIKGATVLLVDDVMTTGATAHDAALTLRKSGAARVVVAALCRAS